MAEVKKRRKQNIDGPLFVDATCIDCDTCRWLAPDLFGRRGGQSAVLKQPSSDAEWLAALEAVLCCPVRAIGALSRKGEITQVALRFPSRIVDGVYYCGFSDPSTFGASSYLIYSRAGNVMVDCPRFDSRLVDRVRAMGGIRYLLLTHVDDAGAHQDWAETFRSTRVCHAEEPGSQFKSVEHKVTGLKAVKLAHKELDIIIIPCPGHTRGHLCFLVDSLYLFSGDHLAWLPEHGHLAAFRQLCWHSWTEQIRSQERLELHSFEWVFPGHGRRFYSPRETMAEEMQTCLRWMRRVK